MSGPARIGDRDGETLRFIFDGVPMRARPGDTLAAALLANGVGLVARSFKYHRPRGIMAAGVEEPNALVTVGEGGRTEPNTRATDLFVYDGLVASSQNRWPSLGFDMGAVNGLVARFLSAGFYYKTFFGPPSRWMVYEKVIRRAAGLGKAPTEADPDRYQHRSAFCDVLVVGGGPAGLVAAMEAAQAGERVLLVEQDRELGGSALR
ncbi:MAG TPA: FAD-dependent oxidoreductase, partial [Sphingomonas sp.]|nr:FAD-dependent oxidoreductase [Sphingomonas sp.]